MKPFRTLRRAITWAGLGLAGGALVVTTRHLLSTPQSLESGLSGEGRIARRREGDIYYTVAGPQDAEPLVLLHDFYPGASNYEFRRVFPRLSREFRLYAPDWLGFGMSERPELAYTGELYADLLTGFLRDTVGRPATVLADGLAGNIAVRAASDQPALFSRLVLVSPRPLAGTQPGPTAAQVVVRATQRTALGLVPYAALSTRAGLRWELRRRAAHAGEGAATDDAVDHAYASAHQFGGHYAPLSLLVGDLDLPVANVFALLELPALVVAGEQDSPQRRLQLEDLTLLNPYARMLTLRGAGDVVHEDQPDAFVERVSLWIETSSRPRAPVPAPTGADLPRASRAGTPQELQQREEPSATVTGGIFDAAEAGADFVPLDVAGNVSGAGSLPETRTVGKPAGEIEEADQPERSDVQAEPAPSRLERTLEAPSAATAQQPAPDQLRSEMSAPEAPVPTTLAAMTAPLDTADVHEEEGTVEPESGPHPIPADARVPEPAETATPHVAAEAEKPARPDQAQRSGARPGRDVPARKAPSASGAAGQQAAGKGKAGEPARGARPSQPNRPGTSGQKRSGRKPKHSQ